jgi:hypothetical protein
MDLVPILREIDAEIDRLKRIRKIVHGLSGTIRLPRARKPRQSKATAETPSIPTPPLIILPPKQKREYRRRLKPVAETPGALGPAPSDRPVFVPRAATTVRTKPNAGEISDNVLEATVRRNLLGGVA